MFVENLIGSRAKVKILRVLAEARTAYSLKNLRDGTEISLSIAHKAAEELAEEGILTRIKGTGKEKLYKFNNDSPFASAIFEMFKTEKTRQRKEVVLMHVWSVLEDVVSKLKDKSFLVALFGSQARGDATIRSDIDLLIVHKGNQDEILGIVDKVKSKSKIQAVVISLEAFKSDIKNNTLFYKNIKSDALIFYINPKIKEDIAKFLKDIYIYYTEGNLI